MNRRAPEAAATRIRQGEAADIEPCAALYAAGFERGLRALFGRMPRVCLLEDGLRAYRIAEPQGFLVLATGTRVEGYVLATHSLRGLVVRIARSAALPRSLARLLRGDYGIAHPRALGRALREVWVFGRQAGRFRLAAGDAQIVSIAVRRDAQGGGAGHALMRAALAYLERVRVAEVRLEVQPDNLPARRLYDSLGFVLRGEIPSPLGRALVMTRELSAAPTLPAGGARER